MRKVLSFSFVLVLLLTMLFCTTLVYATENSPGIIDVGSMVAALTPLGILGLLVAFIQGFVQLTKGLPRIRNVPTDLYVIIVSVIFTQLALFIYAAWVGFTVYWYYVALAALTGFAVAYISMFGWQSLYNLIKRWMRYKG